MAVLTPQPEPPTRHRRPRRFVAPVLLILALAAAGTALVAQLGDHAEPAPRAGGPEPFDYPLLAVAPGEAVPFQIAAPVTEPDRLVRRTDIPERTLRAYLNAEASLRASTPGCGLTWATLAGIGRAESHHGRFGGAEIGSDGRLSPPIIGVRLDGSPGVRAIRDTDGGRLDGDAVWDRAVGAMQFLPATWFRWAARASGDGQPPDPQNIDDAVLSAGRYLCASGGNLATGTGWWQALLTYNKSVGYARDVFSAADAYARAAG